MRIVSLTAIASISAALLATPALADGKNYPATLCAANKSDDHKITRGNSGRVYNETDDDFVMICPAVKDFAQIASATVWVLDQSQPEPVECVVRSSSPTSTTGFFERRSTRQWFHSSESEPLTFPAIRSSSHGVYVLWCSVPGTDDLDLASGIVSYEIVES